MNSAAAASTPVATAAANCWKNSCIRIRLSYPDLLRPRYSRRAVRHNKRFAPAHDSFPHAINLEDACSVDSGAEAPEMQGHRDRHRCQMPAPRRRQDRRASRARSAGRTNEQDSREEHRGRARDTASSQARGRMCRNRIAAEISSAPRTIAHSADNCRVRRAIVTPGHTARDDSGDQPARASDATQRPRMAAAATRGNTCRQRHRSVKDGVDAPEQNERNERESRLEEGEQARTETLQIPRISKTDQARAISGCMVVPGYAYAAPCRRFDVGRTTQRNPTWHVEVSMGCGNRAAGRSAGSSSARTDASRP